jgi:hypothetical protein
MAVVVVVASARRRRAPRLLVVVTTRPRVVVATRARVVVRALALVVVVVVVWQFRQISASSVMPEAVEVSVGFHRRICTVEPRHQQPGGLSVLLADVMLVSDSPSVFAAVSHSVEVWMTQ